MFPSLISKPSFPGHVTLPLSAVSIWMDRLIVHPFLLPQTASRVLLYKEKLVLQRSWLHTSIMTLVMDYFTHHLQKHYLELLKGKRRHAHVSLTIADASWLSHAHINLLSQLLVLTWSLFSSSTHETVTTRCWHDSFFGGYTNTQTKTRGRK